MPCSAAATMTFILTDNGTACPLEMGSPLLSCDGAGDIGDRQANPRQGGEHLGSLIHCQARVLEGSCLGALRGVDHKQDALAGTKRARDFEVGVNEPRCVDEVGGAEVEDVGLAILRDLLQPHHHGLHADCAFTL